MREALIAAARAQEGRGETAFPESAVDIGAA
jgi:hypothetical protein